MHKRKLLIAEGSEEVSAALSELFRGRCQVRACADGDSARQLLRSFRPDVLVLDLMLPGYDGLSLLQWAREQAIRPRILATSLFCNEYVVGRAQNLGVSYLMRKPSSVSAMALQVEDLLCHDTVQENLSRTPEADIRTVLGMLGIPGKLRGYTYLRYAVALYAGNPLQSVTKELYPAVAKQCGCEPSHVERSIRSAIEAGWKKRDEAVWRLYFSSPRDGTVKRPTNGTFIARLAGVEEAVGQKTENKAESVQNTQRNSENIRRLNQ